MPPDRPQASPAAKVTAVVTVAAVEQQLAELAKAERVAENDEHPALAPQRTDPLPS
jgi:hypothetical protein